MNYSHGMWEWHRTARLPLVENLITEDSYQLLLDAPTFVQPGEQYR